VVLEWAGALAAVGAVHKKVKMWLCGQAISVESVKGENQPVSAAIFLNLPMTVILKYAIK